MSAVAWIIGLAVWGSICFVAGAAWCASGRDWERELLDSDEPYLPIRRAR